MIISDAVGETINTLERKQYNLFPNVADFESAVLYQIGKDDPDYKSGYVVEITKTDGKKYRSVNRDSKGIMILRDYFSNYDIIKKYRKSFEKKWHIVAYDYDMSLPITSKEVANNNKHSSSISWAFGAGITNACCLIPLFYIPPEVFLVLPEYPEATIDQEEWLKIISSTVLVSAGAYILGIHIDKKNTLWIINTKRELREVK